MWGQRLPGAGGKPPGLVGRRLGGGAPYFSQVPTAGGAAVVAVVWLDGIVQLEHEVRVASALRKILPTAGRRGQSGTLKRQPGPPATWHKGVEPLTSTVRMAVQVSRSGFVGTKL
jgi:hypothetical protein